MLAGAPDAAAERFAVVWDHAERAGVEDPGVFPVAPELVEALAELGRLEEAEAVTHRLARLSEEQAHPWGRATAKRCASVVGLALRYDESHVTALEASVDDLSGLGLPLDDRAHAAVARPRAAARAEVGCGPPDARARDERVRGARLDRLGRDDAGRARARGCPPPGQVGKPDADRATGRRARGGRAREQGDRGSARRHDQHRRVPSLEHVRQARHPLARAAGSAARGARASRPNLPRVRLPVLGSPAPKASGFPRFRPRSRRPTFVCIAELVYGEHGSHNEEREA